MRKARAEISQILLSNGCGAEPRAWGDSRNVRLLRLGLLAACALGLSGCGSRPPTAEQALESAVEVATSNKAMWYRFTFTGDYQGKPFTIDQMVTCMRTVVPGGSLGQSPDAAISEGYPKTAATKMADGSQILVRIPNMCMRFRKYEVIPGQNDGYARTELRRGWRSPGPHVVLPLVIWSDSTTSPTRIESYVGPAYFTHPKARIKNPKGFLSLWPVGRYPQNAEQVLNAPEAEPYAPNPWFNPDLVKKYGPDEKRRVRDGKYYGKFASYNIIPIDDPIDGFEKHVASLNARSDLSEEGKLKEPEIKDKLFEDQNFVFYEGDGTGNKLRDYALDPSYIPASCITQEIGRLSTGAPGFGDFPYDPADWNALWPLDVQTPGTELHTPGNIALLNARAQRTRNCYERYGQVRSLEVVQGYLDHSRALSGAQVYIPLVKQEDWKGQELQIDRQDAATRYGFKAEFNGGTFAKYRISGLPAIAFDDWSKEYVIKRKSTGKWYYYYATRSIYCGSGENSCF